MKLLIIGSDKVFSIENFYYKYLIELGVDTKRFTAQSIFYDYYFSGNILRKIIFKLGLSSIHKKINNQFKEIVDDFKPDIIWVFKGMEITPESLKWAKSKGIKLVNYNPDNPFIFTGKGSGNAHVTNSIGLYDFHFTYNLEIQKQLQQQYNAKTDFLPFAFDVSKELFDECSKEEEIVKACFLGNPDKIRSAFLEQLAAKGIEIDVFGNDWDKFVTHKNITTHTPVYSNEQWKTLRKYRVQINLMRIHNEDSHNMRTFEVPGIGGLQVAPNTKEHQLFFEEGKEIFLYKDIDECVTKINYLLSLSKEQANEFRTLSNNAAINKKYSYKDRTFQVYNVLKSFV
ncbi:MAG: glycosyltransferase [Bacteroidetes bacterium]|nr:glycosyltransferase [Bacteroidota bacterium]